MRSELHCEIDGGIVRQYIDHPPRQSIQEDQYNTGVAEQPGNKRQHGLASRVARRRARKLPRTEPNASDSIA